MGYKRTTGFPELPIDQYGIVNGTDKNQICNRRITHVITATVDNNRFTTICIIEIHPEQKDYLSIKRFPANLQFFWDHRRYYCHNHLQQNPCHVQKRYSIRHSVWDHVRRHQNIRCNKTRVFNIQTWFYIYAVPTKLWTHTRRNIYYLRHPTGKIVFLKMNKYQSQSKTSIRLFLEINPKLILRNILKNKMKKYTSG